MPNSTVETLTLKTLLFFLAACALQPPGLHSPHTDTVSLQIDNRFCSPETLLEGLSIPKKARLDAEVLSKHAVQQAPVQVPFQGLGEHEALPQTETWRAHMQGQDSLVQHANQVVLLAHDSRYNIVLCQVSDHAQASGVLHLQATKFPLIFPVSRS